MGGRKKSSDYKWEPFNEELPSNLPRKGEKKKSSNEFVILYVLQRLGNREGIPSRQKRSRLFCLERMGTPGVGGTN